MISNGFSHFIQFLSTKLEVFLWDKEHINMLLTHIKPHTLHIDATGNIVKPISFLKKRIFLYSLVAHISDSKIVFPVAHAILSNHTSYDIGRFLYYLREFCKHFFIQVC